MAQLCFRRMAEDDIPAIMAIEAVSFGAHYWSDTIFRTELRTSASVYYVCLDTRPVPQRLVGYMGFWKLRDEVHLTTIAMDPALRGLSLGELGHCHVLGVCLRQGVRWITTEIRVSNHASQNLCYKYGFYAVGLRRRYYQDSEEDALVVVSPDLQSRSWQSVYNRRKAALKLAVGGQWPQGFSV